MNKLKFIMEVEYDTDYFIFGMNWREYATIYFRDGEPGTNSGTLHKEYKDEVRILKRLNR